MISDSILVSQDFFSLCLKSHTTTTKPGSGKVCFDFCSFTGFDLLFLSAWGLQSPVYHKGAFTCSFSFSSSHSQEGEPRALMLFEEGQREGSESTNSPFCCLVTVTQFHQKGHRGAGPSQQVPAQPLPLPPVLPLGGSRGGGAMLVSRRVLGGIKVGSVVGGGEAPQTKPLPNCD